MPRQFEVKLWSTRINSSRQVVGEMGKACQVPTPFASEVGAGINCSNASAPFALAIEPLLFENRPTGPAGIKGFPLPGLVSGQFGKSPAVVPAPVPGT